MRSPSASASLWRLSTTTPRPSPSSVPSPPLSNGRTLPRALSAPSCVKMVDTSAGSEALTPPASISRLRPARNSSIAALTASSDDEHAASTR